MLAAARERFADHISVRWGDPRHGPQDGFPECRASRCYRSSRSVHADLPPRDQDGCRARSRAPSSWRMSGLARLNRLFVEEYLALKERNGYSREEIDRKRFSLEGVLVPVTAAWNEDMLRGCGFRSVDCFWRQLNFAGWIAVK